MMTHMTPIVKLNLKLQKLKSSLCDYSDKYLLASGSIIVPNTGTTANAYIRKHIIIKSCAPFTDYISEINNTHKKIMR